MATSNPDWGVHFSTAISCLMNEDSDDSAHTIITCRLKAFEEKYLVWLKEIPEEIENNLLGTTTTKLTMLPKTPSVRNRAKARLNVVQENESRDDPMESKSEDTNSDVNQVTAITDSPKGRPKRSCKNTVTSPNVKPKRSYKKRTASNTASTRKAGLRASKTQALAPPIEEKPVSKDEDIENNIMTETEFKLVSTGHADSIVPSKVKAVASHVGFEEGSDKSPSVRDRARAYETMLNHKTKSPAKTARVQTPNSANRNFAAATISSLAKSSPQPIVCLGKRLSSPATSPCPSKMSSKAAARRSRSSRSFRISKSRSEQPAHPPKPTRSKLALAKKPAEIVHQPEEHERSENIPLPNEVVKKGKNRSSLDSALSSASSMMSPKSCDDDQQIAAGENLENAKDFVSNNERIEEDMDEGLDVTHTVITEVYDLSADGKEDLVDYEMVQTKTSSSVQDSNSDTQVSEEKSSNNSSSTVVTDNDDDQNITKELPEEPAPLRTTRTRARAIQANKSSMETSVKNSPSCPSTSTSTSYTELKLSLKEDVADQQSKEEEQQLPRTTRTRARAKNQQEEEKPEETVRTRTRTREKPTELNKDVTESSVRDVSVVSNVQRAPSAVLSPELAGGMRTTRSRMRKNPGAESLPCGTYDEVVAGSPAIKTANGIRCSKKRPVEETGASPRPKRSRSCAGMAGPNSTFNTQSILLTSSPRRALDDDEDDDTVDSSLMSPVQRQPKPFVFLSAQKSSFMKRTPAFARTNSKVYSFIGSSTPTQNNSGVLSSFLKRNTPKSKATPLQVLQEQKKQKLQEKESKEKERLRRAAEAKKQKLEEQKRLRDDRLRKVAEAREKKQREELEQKERINKKFEDQASLKDKMLEEKLKAETEKKEMREKKMMEANSRRRQEEEDRLRKRAEMEEEARRQQDWLQRKKEYEEEERKRHLEEEKRKQEERMLKIQEEKAKQKRMEEEKRERLRKERERQLALEKAEKEREKREEKERRLEEQRRQEEQKRVEEQKRAEEQRKLQEIRRAQEQEKIRLMEAAHKRAQEEAMRIEREREAKKIELQKLIDQTKNASTLNTSTTAKESASSYMITPVKAKVYKPSTDPNNYDIADKGSDESTDEEDAPKKKIPEWAMGVYLNAALIKQYKNPPDIKKIFRPHLVEAPDLVKLFPTSRQRHRFRYRTSSAIWTSPAMKK